MGPDCNLDILLRGMQATGRCFRAGLSMSH